MLFAIRFVNAPLTWNNFLSRAADFYSPSCNPHVKQLFSSRWMNIHEGRYHPLLAPQFLLISPPTAALSSLTSLSSLSLPNPPFVAVYELLYTGYSDWVCCTSSMSIYICQSCGIYTAGWEVTDDVALLGGYKYDCCMFLSNSDHQVLIQDLEIVCPWILKHSPICPRRQQELKTCFSMDNPKPDWFV